MNSLEKYNEQQIVPNSVFVESANSSLNSSDKNLFVSILRRWRIIICTFLLVSIVGIPVIWFTIKPSYQAVAAIRITPVIPSILFGGENAIPMYKNFMYTQADLMTSNNVLQRVTDDLVAKDPSFFDHKDDMIFRFRKPGSVDPVAALRNMLNSETITVIPENNTELIKIKMTSPTPQRAVQVVNAFIRAYMTIVVSDEAKSEDQKLTILEDEYKTLTKKLENQRRTIREMAKEYGTDSLDKRQEIMLERVAALQSKLTELEMQKITLQVQIKLHENSKEQDIEPEKLLRLRYEFTNSDLMTQNLIANITQLEQTLIVAEQQLAPTNPELERKRNLLTALNERLDKRRKEVGESFDKMVVSETVKSDMNQLKKIKAQLEQVLVYEEHLRESLSKEDVQTIELGRKQLAIQDMQSQLNMTQDLYETVGRRIKQLEMERKRPARVSEAYYANAAPYQDQRSKYTMALAFGAMGMGVSLALIRNRFDRCLYTPEDIANNVGVQVVGTVTRPTDVKKQLQLEQVTNDCQTICTNLGLYNVGNMFGKIVVTSPGSSEGKTTLAINLATNISKAGHRVLLIDGDLRKPDVAKMLNLPDKGIWLLDLLRGTKYEDVVCSNYLPNLDVLTSKKSKAFDIFRLISNKNTGKLINQLGRRYNFMIIDTPPILAVPDAILWTKMADAVVVTSFAGQTESSELKETLKRLKMLDAKILGTVLNNVSLNYSYNSYGSDYYADYTTFKKKNYKRSQHPVLLPSNRKNETLGKTI